MDMLLKALGERNQEAASGHFRFNKDAPWGAA